MLLIFVVLCDLQSRLVGFTQRLPPEPCVKVLQHRIVCSSVLIFSEERNKARDRNPEG